MFKMSFSQLAKKQLRKLFVFKKCSSVTVKYFDFINCVHNFLSKHLLQCNYCNRGLVDKILTPWITEK